MDESPGKMYALAAVLMTIAIVAVPLRFYARAHQGTHLGWDDWLMIPALLFTLLTGISIVIGAALGDLGRHTKVVDGMAVPTERTVIFQKVSYWTLMTQTLTFGLTKLAVLLFYKRIFRGTVFTAVVWTGITLIVAWTIAFFFANLFQCVPIYINWQGEGATEQNCIDETSMYLAQAWSDVWTDIAILAIPIPMVWKLHMPTRRKVGVMGIFLLGALVVAAGATKLAVFNEIAKEFEEGDQDLSYFLTPVLYWPMVESSLGILGACLPTYRPLISRAGLESVVASIRSIISLQSLRSEGSRSRSRYAGRNLETGSQDSTTGITREEHILAGNDSKSHYAARVEGIPMGHVTSLNVPKGEILVQSETTVDKMV